MACGYFEDKTKQGLLLRQNVAWEVPHSCVVFVCTGMSADENHTVQTKVTNGDNCHLS
jgi:co-chaperonin GroES (HSP10)